MLESLQLKQYSFILEGILTVLVATISFFLVWDEPSIATFLSDREKAAIVRMLDDSRATTTSAEQLEEKSAFDMKQIKAAFLDWQVSLSQHLNMSIDQLQLESNPL